jgi:hypothetical protein
MEVVRHVAEVCFGAVGVALENAGALLCDVGKCVGVVVTRVARRGVGVHVCSLLLDEGLI